MTIAKLIGRPLQARAEAQISAGFTFSMVMAKMVVGDSATGMMRAIIGTLTASTRLEAAHHRVAIALRFWNQAKMRNTPLTAATKLPATINVGRSIDILGPQLRSPCTRRAAVNLTKWQSSIC